MKHRALRRPSFKTRLHPIAAVLAAGFGLTAAQAANVNWIGPNLSFWDLATNWNPGVPTAVDDVLLGAANTEFRTQSGTLTINSYTGAGQLRVSGGTLLNNVSSSIGSLQMSSGSLGGGGNLTITGAASITYGDMRGTGTTFLQGATTISGSGFRLDGGRVVSNQNTLTWTAGQVLFNNTFSGASGGAGSGTINNQAGATFIANGDGASSMAVTNFGGTDTGADAVFNNAGTFRKTGSGATNATAVGVAFNNSGAVQAQTGILNLTGGGTHTGSFDVSAGAVLGFGGGTHNLNGTSVTSPGTVRVSGGAIVNVNTAYAIAGTTEIQSGSFNLVSGNASTGALNQIGGALEGSGNFTVTGVANIADGQMRGSGRTILQGPTSISNAGLGLDSGRVLDNRSVLTWTGGNINLNSTNSAGAGTILNGSAATFIASGNGANSIGASGFGSADTGADAVFTNAGIFRKEGSGATNTTTVGVVFNNSGAVQAQTGILSFTSTSTHTGSIDVSAGATLRLSGGTHSLNGASVTTAGVFELGSGGTLNAAVPIVINGTGSFNQSGGVLQGADLTIASAASITNGQMRGSGSTILQGPTTISGNGLGLDSGRVLDNRGVLTWTGGYIDLNSTNGAGAGMIDNRAGSTFVASGAGAYAIYASNYGAADNGADAVFNNAGTFRKSGSGATDVTIVEVAFNNNGAVLAQTGVLNLAKGGTSTGSLDVSAGAVLGFTGGTYQLNGGSITALGTLRVTGTAAVNVDMPYHIAGTTEIHQSGSFNLLGGDASTGALVQSGGSLNGSGTFTVTGPATITYGEHRGSGTTRLQGASTIGGNGMGLDGGRVLDNRNVLTWTGGSINLNSTNGAGAGGIVNGSAATFIASGNNGSSIYASSYGAADNGADAVFNNAGTFRKSGSGATDATRIVVAFNNNGAVQAQTGILNLEGGGTHTGSFDVSAGATLRLSDGTHNLNGASVTTAGIFELGGGTLNVVVPTTINGTGSFNQSGGVLQGANLTIASAASITNGQMRGSGSTILQGPTTISSGGLDLDSGRVLDNRGVLTWTGGDINLDSTNSAGVGMIDNRAGATFVASGAGAYAIHANNYGTAGADAVFNNAGTFRKSGSGATDATRIVVAFNNNGAVQAQTGVLNLEGGGTHTGSFDVSAGAVLGFGGGTHNLNGGSVTSPGTVHVSGSAIVNVNTAYAIAGTTEIQGGSFNLLGGNASTGALTQSGGTLEGSGNFTVTGASTITYGDMRGSGRTILQGPTTISSNGLGLDSGRVLDNRNVLTWTAGNINLNSANGAGAGTILNGSAGTFIASGNGPNNIWANSFADGDTGTDAAFNNAGIFRKEGSGATNTTTVDVAFNNSGAVQADSGVLQFNRGVQGPTGSITIGSAGAVTLVADSTVGRLQHNGTAATSLNLGLQTLTVYTDYDNAGFGSGDAFNRRANVLVTGAATPRLLAAGDVNQALTGAAIVNGNGTTPTLVIGNVHVGSTTFTYDITNTGSSGPALRGAIQTGVNGASITDARLSGSGVTAGNWGPLAAGDSVSREVTLTVNTAGVFAPISPQTVNILNNFENTRSQLLTIGSAAGAAAYNLAAAAVAPNPVNLGNQRVGGTAVGLLTISNTAAAGAFSEGLNASFGVTTGAASGNGGAINLLAAGASNGTLMGVRLDGSSAGAKTGTVQINFTSDGTGTSGLGTTALAPQTVTVNGNFYNMAVGSTTPNAVVIGNQRVGGSGSAALTVSNTAAAGAFSEDLRAGFGGNSGAAANNGGLVTALLAGASDNSALRVGVNTATAGAKSGSVTVNYQTNGTVAGVSNGLGAAAVGSQVVNVSGNVYQLASGNLVTNSLNFGTVQVGQSVQTTLQVQNTASGPAGFVEDLNVKFGSTSGTGASLISGSGQLNGITAGSTSGAANGTMTVSVNTAAAGTVNGAIGVNYFSAGAVNGVSNGLGELAVGSQNFGVVGQINAIANVIDQARPVANGVANLGAVSVNLGAVRIGGTLGSSLSMLNEASGNAQAALNASITSGGSPVTASGSFNLLAPGASSSALQVGLNTGSAGAKSGSATISYVSDASNVGNCAPNCQLSIGTQTVNVSGAVYQVAQASMPASVNLGNFRVGGAAPTQALTIANTSIAPAGFQEGLDAAVQSISGKASATGSISNLAAGGSSQAITVGLNNATAGANSGSVVLALASNGSGTSGLATLGLGTATVNVSGTGYNAAVGSASPSPVAIANQRVGGTASAALTVSNTAAVGAFSEDLRASFGSNSGAAIHNGGVISALLAGASNNGTMSVGVDTATAGAKSGSVTVNYQTNGTVGGNSNGLGTAAAGSQVVNVSGNVYQLAAGNLVNNSLNFGTVQVGQSVQTTLQVQNTATGPAGFVEDLNVKFGGSSGTGASLISGSGQLNGITAGSTSGAANGTMTVAVNTAAAGTVNGAIGVNYFSAGAVNGVSNGLGELAVGSQDFGVQGQINAVANVIDQVRPVVNGVGNLATVSVNLGAVRVGGTLGSSLSVLNEAGGNAQAALNASITSSGSPVTASGSFNLLAPGASSSALQVGLNTGSAGAKSGSAVISFVSDAANVGNCAPNCQLSIGTQTVNVQGKVYAQAVGQLDTATLNFGIVRVGDVVAAKTIEVSNTAAVAGLNDTLRAQLSGTGGPFGGAGSVSGVLAGGKGGMAVTLATGAAGVYNQLGTVSFLSQNPDMADVSAGASQQVQLQAQVNNLADARFRKLGGQGSLTQQGNTFVLDFGTLVLGSSVSTVLDILNAAGIGPSDELDAAFDLGQALGLLLSGWDAIDDLQAGFDSADMQLGLLADTLGLFERQITLDGASVNASDPTGLGLVRSLIVRANVIQPGQTVPEPSGLLLAAAALAAALAARRRGPYHRGGRSAS
ncbi:MAG: choice-of-anchor D domain-containing protein [Rubrivivax sp.]